MNNDNLPLVLYGAGDEASKILKKSIGDGEVGYPVCFCDASYLKQGSKYLGLPVYSIEQVREKYGDEFNFYITPQNALKYKITDYLLSLGFNRERILNYEPRSKYMSCLDLRTHAGIGDWGMNSCCLLKRPQVNWDDKNNSLEKLLSAFVKMRDNTIDAIKYGESTICDGCYSINEQFWLENEKIKLLRFELPLPCQLSCIFCNRVNARKPSNSFQKNFVDKFRFSEFINLLETRDLISSDVTILFAAGEITVAQHKDEYLDAVRKYRVVVLSNGVLFDEKVAEVVGGNNGKINISVDAGIRETYTRVKGLDAFDIVWENIRKYIACGIRVAVKYIFHEKNSNDEDVEGFIREAKKSPGIDCVVVSADSYRERQLSDEQIRLAVKMLLLADQAKIRTEYAIGDSIRPYDLTRIEELYAQTKTSNSDAFITGGT